MNETFITALLSVAFGWSLNELGQWFRTRKEDKKIKKKVLYILLDTHFKFSRLDLSQFVQIATDKVLSKIPENEQSEELKQYLNKLYSEMLEELMHADVAKELSELEEKYTNAIDSLATVDPITAYRLNGKTQIMKTFDSLKDYYDCVKAHFPGHENLIESNIIKATNYIKPEIIKISISEIEKEIYALSYSINPWIWYKAQSTLKKQIQRRKIESVKKMDEIFETLELTNTN
jgi:flagellin-specific chaperone FliS